MTIAGIELPALPLDVEVEDLEDGWNAAEATLTMPAPRPPHGAEWEVDAWADEVLSDWMIRRGEAVRTAQRALGPAREGSPEVSVVASMLLGIVYSRFALDLRGIPTPPLFARAPERAHAFREALEAAARPLWRRALDAFGSCAAVAGAQPAYSLADWRERCDREIRDAEPLADEVREDP